MKRLTKAAMAILLLAASVGVWTVAGYEVGKVYGPVQFIEVPVEVPEEWQHRVFLGVTDSLDVIPYDTMEEALANPDVFAVLELGYNTEPEGMAFVEFMVPVDDQGNAVILGMRVPAGHMMMKIHNVRPLADVEGGGEGDDF